jgi:hypothetical protein
MLNFPYNPRHYSDLEYIDDQLEEIYFEEEAGSKQAIEYPKEAAPKGFHWEYVTSIPGQKDDSLGVGSWVLEATKDFYDDPESSTILCHYELHNHKNYNFSPEEKIILIGEAINLTIHK